MKFLRARSTVLFMALGVAIGLSVPLLPSSALSSAASPALSGVVSVVGDNGGSYCGLLSSGGVDCWGYGADGELGNGIFYSNSLTGSPTPVQVEGVGGTGTLSGVASLVGGDNNPGVSSSSSFCALLTSGGVDCWGYGSYGELGNGASSSSATPLQVEGVGGIGTLSGVASLTSSPGSVCALLTSGGVDCWGYGPDGELGNSGTSNSATPVQVEGVGGTGTLSGVSSVVGSGVVEGYPSFSEQPGYCALVASGGVDCWGNGAEGQLGNGASSNSATPVQVEGIGGIGTLSGVSSLTGDGFGYCGVLSGGADCWGYGSDGELGNGATSNSSTPVQVEGVGGTGTLSGVSSITGAALAYCTILTSGGVDCWGSGGYGELGNGGSSNSATPAQVKGVGGVGALSGVSSLTSEGLSFCGVGSGAVVCWGYGGDGELGNGVFSSSSTPVAVEGVGGAGSLSQVASVTGNYLGSYCALLTFRGVDCWGDNSVGELGNGDSTGTGSDTPVQVVSVVTGTTTVALPSAGATVTGNQWLDATASAGATQVQFELTGGTLTDQVISSSSQTIYGWIGAFNSASVPNGTYTLQSIASFGGPTVDSAGITITVSNPVPTTSVLLPSGSATLSGGQILDASASPGVTQVQYELTGGILSDDIVATATPTFYGWIGGWDTRGVPNGTYTLQSVATAGGLSGTSSGTTITVDNAEPNTSILVPSNGATLSGSQYLDASATGGVIQVQFEVTGGSLHDQTVATAVQTAYGWIAGWNTTSVPDGTYTLQSFASYSGGVTGTSSGITITVNN